jgi:hypothetical protein
VRLRQRRLVEPMRLREPLRADVRHRTPSALHRRGRRALVRCCAKNGEM